MAKVAKKLPAPKYISLRSGVKFAPTDVLMIEELRQALALERDGPVTLSETIRDALRFRARKRGIKILI